MGRTKRVLLMCLVIVALATVATVAAIVPGLTNRGGTARLQEPSDEQVVRRVWQVPDYVPCKSLIADPATPGFYGREGLRIVATYEFFPGGLSSYRTIFRPNDWRPLPLPPSVTGIHRGAAEFDGLREGVYLCLVESQSPAGPSNWLPLDAPAAPKGYGRHTIGVLDIARNRLLVICQNHY